MDKINQKRFSLVVSGLLAILAVAALVWSCSPVVLGPVIEGSDRPGSASGQVSFSIDLAGLGLASEGAGRAAVTVTSVSVTLTRTGYAPIVKALTVTANVAKGSVTNLDAGYWHVAARIDDATSTLFTGEADINVVAGSSVPCVLLFDPIVIAPTTGGIDFTVGLNPLPGYKALGIASPVVLPGKTAIYVLDSGNKLLAVYDSAMVRIKDIPLPEAPVAACLNRSQDRLLLGYANGTIYALDPSDGSLTKKGDVLMAVTSLAALSDDLVLALGSQLKVLRLSTGQITGTATTFYSLVSPVFAPATSTVYLTETGVSPSDLRRIRLDVTTGAILSVSDSIYHGDYSLGTPLRLLRNGTRIVTSSGNMFGLSTVVADDLIYAGALSTGYVDLVSDDARNRTYLISSTSLKKLVVLDGTTDFSLQSVDVLGDPRWLFQTDTGVTLFTQSSGQYYTRTFLKADLL